VYRERSFVDYIQDLRLRVIRISIAIGASTVFCMTFGIDIFNIDGYTIPLPYPDTFHNIAIQIVMTMKKNLLPQSVNLIQLTPQGAFFTQIYVSALLGIIIAMPIIVRELAAFIGPGLYQHEKTNVKKFTASAIILFATGCLTSYFVVIPYILDFLYKYGQSIDVSTFFDIGQFVPFVMQFLIIFGFSYQLPIIMWATTVSGIVGRTFWRHNLRYAIMIIIIFGAFITPDGSGVTMWFVAGPMLLLYVIGMLILEEKIKPVWQRY
jgi:sec-independent protein translocase protein TatC